MTRNSFIKSGFWLLLVLGAIGIAVSGCDFASLFGGEEEVVNQPPTLEILAVKTSVKSGENLTILITSSNDPDGDELTFTWKVINTKEGKNVTNLLQVSDTFATFIAPVVTEATDFIVTVEADDGHGGKASAPVTITVNPLASGTAFLSLDKEVVSATVGGTATIAATAFNADGTADSVIADSSDVSVATVSVGDLDQDDQTTPIIITGVSKGSVTVVITSDSGLTETVTVAVIEIGEGILILDETAVSVIVGESVAVNAIAIKEDGSSDTISAESLDTDIATVLVIANVIKIDGVSLGVTEVLVTSGEGEIATIDVFVTSEDDQTIFILSETLLAIPVVGNKDVIEVIAIKADGSPDTVSATSNDTSIATASLSGSTLTITGVASGDTTVIVESGSGRSESVKVVVGELPILLLEKTTSVVAIGGKDFISVTALDDNGNPATVDATIEPSGIADITTGSKTITVTGVSIGNATITVTSSVGLSASVAVSVGEAILLDKTSLTVESGETEIVGVTARKADGTDDTFTAQIDPSGIATLTVNLSSQNIEVLGVGAGNATITVNSVSGGLSATAAVTVTTGPAVSIASLSGDSQTGVAGSALTDPFVVIVKDANGNPVNGIGVTFAVTAGGGSLAATTATTGVGGSASANLTLGTTVGTNTITASSTGLSGSPVTFNATGVFGPTSTSNSTVVASPTAVSLDGSSTAMVTVTLKDANNNLINGHNVTISSGIYYPTTITPSSGTTDTSGQVTFTVSPIYNLTGIMTDGTAIITATDTSESATLATPASITFSLIIEAGEEQTITLKSDGTLRTWGDNEYGQLGDGTTVDSSVPVSVSFIADVKFIGGGRYHNTALKSDGTAWTWGRNNGGQLGDGTSGAGTNKNTPVQVCDTGQTAGCTQFLSGVVAISGGNVHSLALKSDGTVWAWGKNDKGQLGDEQSCGANLCSTPVQVKGFGGSGFLTGVVAIAAGDAHSVALKSDGTVWTWGRNAFGQLGDGTFTQRNTPVQVSGLTDVSAIASRRDHTVALKSGGSVWTWGYNLRGQLGDNTTTNSSTPVQVKGPGGAGFLINVISISAGVDFSVAFRNDDSVWTWGSNSFGQLGDGTATTQSNTPVQVKGIGGSGFLTGVISLSARGYHTVVLKNDGKVWTWGRGENGQMGNGTNNQINNTPVEVTGL